MMRLCVLAFCAVVPLADTGAAGRLPLQHPLEAGLHENETISIEGTVEGASGATAVLRIDDALSSDYASRANLERTLPPGPFHWETGVKGLRSSSGRLLDLKSVRELRLFAPAGGTVSITKIDVKAFEPLPGGAIAYSFGSNDAPLFPGFERISPGNPMIVQGHPEGVRRPGPDPLIASGLSGIEALLIPWREPRARVTLWTEDPGDWETLPHPLERRIRVYGKTPADVLYERLTPDAWLRGRYLRGLHGEHSPSDDAWTAYGQKRGGLISFETETGPAGIRIELAGDSPAATFLNAIVVETAGQTAARDEAEARRAAWYRSTWPVAAPRGDPEQRTASTALSVFIAPGSGAQLPAFVLSKNAIEHPLPVLEPPSLGGTSLHTLAWAAQRRLERNGASGTTLTLGDSTLSPDLTALPLRAGEMRRYDLWISVPDGTSPGVYRGAFGIAQDPSVRIPIAVEVLPVTLPKAAKPAGFYLEEAPQWSFFWGQKESRRQQLACDLRLLESLGIAGNAPALAMPFAEDEETFLKDMQAAALAHNQPPWLAYSAAKRIAARVGPFESADILKRAEARLRDAGLVPPVWSIADEPSNAEAQGLNLKGWLRTLRIQAPDLRLAAQLNSPSDADLAPLFDVAIINSGFGIDERDIARVKSGGSDVWLYNTGRPRVTAGLWLWLTGASRYIQWHARMPAADPFDPLDGREGDVQMILPGAEPCPAQHGLNRAIFEMADGLTDQRWLLWLSGQSTPEAKALAEQLRLRFQGRYAKAAALSPNELDAIRSSIAGLARKMKLTQR
jgi:hypothetical protein